MPNSAGHKNWRADANFVHYASLKWPRDLERAYKDKSQTAEKKLRVRYTGWLGAVDFFFNAVQMPQQDQPVKGGDDGSQAPHDD